MAVSSCYPVYAFQADKMEKTLTYEEIERNVDNTNDIFVKTADDMSLAAESIGRLAEYVQSLGLLAKTESSR